jgi:hypothetical protein
VHTIMIIDQHTAISISLPKRGSRDNVKREQTPKKQRLTSAVCDVSSSRLQWRICHISHFVLFLAVAGVAGVSCSLDDSCR